MINTLFALLLTWFRPTPSPVKVIFIGIDYGCFSLAAALLDNKKTPLPTIEISAFIDDEPWNNRTLVHGVTVYSPSEISALVRKHKVSLIVQIEDESIHIADNIWEGVLNTKVEVITLTPDQTLADRQAAIYKASIKHADNIKTTSKKDR